MSLPARRIGRPNSTRHEAITMNATLERDVTITSPYTARSADAAIRHLERVLSAEGANSLFGQTYWRSRVRQVSATRGLLREQRARLERLMDLLAEAGCISAASAEAPARAR